MSETDYRRYDYNFHGLLRARIQVSMHERGLTKLEDYYDAYRISDLGCEPDVTLKIGAFKPARPIGSVSFDRKTVVGEGYLQYHDSDGTSSWIVEITENGTGKVIIRFFHKGGGIDRILAPNMFPIAFSMRPMVETRLSFLGWGATHGLGLKSASGEGILLVAPGGFGKTTIAMRAMLEGGYRYLGDERVLVGDKRMKSLFTQIGLFRWKMRNLGQEWIQGPARYPSFLKMIWQLRSPSMHADTDFIGEYGAESATLDRVVILKRGNTTSARLEEISLDEAVSSIVWNSYAELISGYVYMTSKSKPSMLKPLASSEMVGEESLLGGHLRRLENILLHSFPSRCHALIVPNSDNDWRRILSALTN